MTAPRASAADVRRLLAVLRRRVAPQPDDAPDVAAERIRVAERLDRVGADALPAVATHHPLVRFLPAVIEELGRTDGELAEALTAIGAALPWRYGYDARRDRPGLESRMGWAEIVGPAAPHRSDEVCLGLTLLGPHTDYLAHRHPAIELYDVVAGHPVWTLEGRVFRPDPGDAVLHASNAVHAMRTTARPLLAIYSWTGDVVSPSVWADPPTTPTPRP